MKCKICFTRAYISNTFIYLFMYLFFDQVSPRTRQLCSSVKQQASAADTGPGGWGETYFCFYSIFSEEMHRYILFVIFHSIEEMFTYKTYSKCKHFYCVIVRAFALQVCISQKWDLIEFLSYLHNFLFCNHSNMYLCIHFFHLSDDSELYDYSKSPDLVIG